MDGVDHLSNCPALPRILTCLPVQDWNECLTLSKSVHQTIAKNLVSLARVPAQLHIHVREHVVNVRLLRGHNTSWIGAGAKRLDFDIKDTKIENLRSSFPLFLKKAVTPRGENVDLAPMDSQAISSKHEGVRIVLGAVLGHVELGSTLLVGSGSTLYADVVAIFTEHCRRYYKGDTKSVRLSFGDNQFREEYHVIAKMLACRSYLIGFRRQWNQSLLTLNAEAMEIKLEQYIWNVKDMHNFIEEWRSGKRDVGWIEADVSNMKESMLVSLAESFGLGIRRMTNIFNPADDRMKNGFSLKRDVEDGQELFVTLNLLGSKFSIMEKTWMTMRN